MQLRLRNRVLDLMSPKVMGILNVTPDSFYDGGQHAGDTLQHCEKMLREGANIIDVGGMSSRPGATIISEEEELQRVLPVLEQILRAFPEAILSVDTIRARVADEALAMGAHLINDISAARFDGAMLAVVAKHQAAIALMHMQGLPADMQTNPTYNDVVGEVRTFFTERMAAAEQAGVKDMLLDVGFGFGKSVEHNYQLLKHHREFTTFGKPLLAGISRKSMINQVLGTKPENALNGTTALHTLALHNGANILRVHDVKEAMECVKLWEAYFAA